MRTQHAFGLAAIALTGCVSGEAAQLRREAERAERMAITFDSADGGAFLLVAERMNASRETDYYFRQIDVDTGIVSPDDRVVSLTSFNDTLSHEKRFPLRMAGGAVPAGDYVYYRQATYSMMGGGADTCYGEGTFVFRMEPGKINIVDVDDMYGFNADLTLQEINSRLAQYPGLVAPVVYAEPVAEVSFDASKNFLNVVTCSPDRGVAMRPVQPREAYLEENREVLRILELVAADAPSEQLSEAVDALYDTMDQSQ